MHRQIQSQCQTTPFLILGDFQRVQRRQRVAHTQAFAQQCRPKDGFAEVLAADGPHGIHQQGVVEPDARAARQRFARLVTVGQVIRRGHGIRQRVQSFLRDAGFGQNAAIAGIEHRIVDV